MPEAEKDRTLLTTNRKALTINLAPEIYGTFAEIGAGQEVARHFFQAGAAANTVAKTMSAYDMKFSDEIYGKATRYVSRDRLISMLQHEYVLLLERLQAVRGEKTHFFVFADTVATKSFKGPNDGHGWLGVRFQTAPMSPPSDIVIHVRMWDKDAVTQQQALGIVGVNLLYAANYFRGDPVRFIDSLVDSVGSERVEVDMITFTGPEFATIDNRLMSLLLVQRGLTNAVLFDSRGQVQQPSEVFYKKAVVVERGSFRPVTHINVDMLRCAVDQFAHEPGVRGRDSIVLMEITMNNLLAAGELDPRDFLSRVDLIAAMGHNVLISNYSEYYRLVSYFRRYTKEMIGITMGINNLMELFSQKYYEDLEGGILESFGRLFRHAVKLYIYPMRKEAFERYLGSRQSGSMTGVSTFFTSDVLITAHNVQMPTNLAHLYSHLVDNGNISCLTGYDERVLGVFSRDVLKKIRTADPAWEPMVPELICRLIKTHGYFGYGSEAPDRAAPAASAPAAST